MENIIRTDDYGVKRWELPKGDLYREYNPAVEWTNGDEIWCIYGRKHRENGSAVEFIDSEKYWWLNGVEYTEKEYKCKMRSIELKILL